MWTQAFRGLGFFFSCSSPDAPKAGKWNPTSRPVPTAAPVFRNARRSTVSDVAIGHLKFFSTRKKLRGLGLCRLKVGGAVNRLANALVRAAAADVSAHEVVNIRVSWFRFFLKQSDSGHNLSGLTVAALRNVFLHPRLLYRMASVGGKTFNCCHVLPGHSEIGVMQERVASPLMCTVHAPQSAMPQPNFVPVMFSVSRRTHNKGI